MLEQLKIFLSRSELSLISFWYKKPLLPLISNKLGSSKALTISLFATMVGLFCEVKGIVGSILLPQYLYFSRVFALSCAPLKRLDFLL